MKLNFIKNNKLPGFTLMELTLYLSILVIMSAIIANIFILLNKGGSNVEAKSELNSNFHFTVEKMKRDIYSATAVNTPATASATSTTLDLTVDGQSVKYTVTGTQISRQIATQTPDYITTDLIKINSLIFTKLENTNTVLNKKRVSIEINISGSYNSTSPDLNYSQQQKTTVSLNKDF
jgi:type II secretory pathway component PulJ